MRIVFYLYISRATIIVFLYVCITFYQRICTVRINYFKILILSFNFGLINYTLFIWMIYDLNIKRNEILISLHYYYYNIVRAVYVDLLNYASKTNDRSKTNTIINLFSKTFRWNINENRVSEAYNNKHVIYRVATSVEAYRRKYRLSTVETKKNSTKGGEALPTEKKTRVSKNADEYNLFIFSVRNACETRKTGLPLL